MLRVAVIGASGRMGTVACAALEHDPEVALVARIERGDVMREAAEAGAQVAVEFTGPDAVKANTLALLRVGVHVVVGASGLSAADLDELRVATGEANCLVVPNFAVGAVLLMRLAEQAARVMDQAEIIELHHPGKRDAPSGTARATAERIAAAREGNRDRDGRDGRDGSPGAETGDAPGAADECPVDGSRPARGWSVAGVAVHSVRLPGVLASQEVLFGAAGQTLSLRHDTLDREAFMPGLRLAVKRVPALPGLSVGLDTLLS